MTRTKLDQFKGGLNPAQITAGINAASQNAKQLCEDALLLLNEKRYPSAASLAILSIEESGKVSILRELALAKNDKAVLSAWQETVSKTGFVQRELKDAIDATSERPEGQIFIIPARLDECTVPDSLQGLHWVDLFREDGFDRLIRSLEHFSSSRQGS